MHKNSLGLFFSVLTCLLFTSTGKNNSELQKKKSSTKKNIARLNKTSQQRKKLFKTKKKKKIYLKQTSIHITRLVKRKRKKKKKCRKSGLQILQQKMCYKTEKGFKNEKKQNYKKDTKRKENMCYKSSPDRL